MPIVSKREQPTTVFDETNMMVVENQFQATNRTSLFQIYQQTKNDHLEHLKQNKYLIKSNFHNKTNVKAISTRTNIKAKEKV